MCLINLNRKDRGRHTITLTHSQAAIRAFSSYEFGTKLEWKAQTVRQSGTRSCGNSQKSANKRACEALAIGNIVDENP